MAGIMLWGRDMGMKGEEEDREVAKEIYSVLGRENRKYELRGKKENTEAELKIIPFLKFQFEK